MKVDTTTGLKSDQRNKLEDQLFVIDDFPDAEPYTPARYRGTLKIFNGLRQRALDELGTGTATSSPAALALAGRMPELPVPLGEAAAFSAKNLNKVGALLAGVSPLTKVVDVVGQSQEECLCSAVNPPCPPCDDLGVLLARITACGCDIVTICNLVRMIVISPAALQYWLPIHSCWRPSAASKIRSVTHLRKRIAAQLEPLRQAAELLLGSERTMAPLGGTTHHE